MRSAGFDPSLTSYGWAIYDSEAEGINKKVASGHVKTVPTTVPVARYCHFRSLVFDILNRFNVSVVGIESPAYGGGEFSERHFGLMMFSMEAVFEKRKDLVLYDPSTVKFLTTGNSKASKTDMIRQAQIDMMSTQNYQADEIDAFHVAKFASRFYQLKLGLITPNDLTPEEKRTFIQRSKKVKGILGSRIKRTAHIFRENNRFFMFSKIPKGGTGLPDKDKIDQDILDWLEESF